MNTSVDVLAVMDDYPDLLDFAAIHYGACVSDCKGAYISSPHVIESLATARKARAAVAELIEACEMLQKHPDDSEVQAEFCNALARVKGV